jgi:hypothetical protein
MPQSIDITGQRFGRLTAIRMTAMASSKLKCGQRWLFRCDCGNEIEIKKASVTSGHTQSCGCLQAQSAQQAGKRNATHRHLVGGKRSPEYASWRDMHTRCENPNHNSCERYGGRGITICERWNSFENFLADMGPKPSPKHQIDRIDNDGNYEPSNCQWATRTEQANNRCSNRLLTVDGRTQTFAQWEREANIPSARLHYYITRRGFSLELVAHYIRRKLDEARAA